MEELVIEVSSSGRVEAMYSDKLNLGFLGAQKVVRQSDIVFDEGTQTWGIWYLPERETNRQLQGFDTYEAARLMEVAWLNTCRLWGVAPMGEEGVAIAGRLAPLYRGR